MNAGRGHSVIFDCTPVLIIDRVIIYEAGRLSCLAAKLPGNRPLRPDAQTTIVLGRAELATLSRRIEEGLVFFFGFAHAFIDRCEISRRRRCSEAIRPAARAANGPRVHFGGPAAGAEGEGAGARLTGMEPRESLAAARQGDLPWTELPPK